MVKTGKKLGGRPRQSQAGLREQVGVRIAPEVKQLLKQAARRNGSSVTKEIESRLATSFSVGRQAHIAALMASVGKLAAALETRFEKRFTEDAFTAQALSVAVEKQLFHFGRSGKPELPSAVKKWLTEMTEMPPADKERFSTPKGWGEFQAGVLISLIEGAQKPLPGMTPEVGPWGWGYYELRKALGSGWQRNRAAWWPADTQGEWSVKFPETKGGAS
jgi:hypothetical protein